MPPSWSTGATNYAWDLEDGGTPSSDTGPTGAHGGYLYMYTEATPRIPGDLFDMSYDGSDCAGQSVAVTFWYHMKAGDGGMGTLRVKDAHGVERWSLSGSQGWAAGLPPVKREWTCL